MLNPLSTSSQPPAFQPLCNLHHHTFYRACLSHSLDSRSALTSPRDTGRYSSPIKSQMTTIETPNSSQISSARSRYVHVPYLSERCADDARPATWVQLYKDGCPLFLLFFKSTNQTPAFVAKLGFPVSKRSMTPGKICTSSLIPSPDSTSQRISTQPATCITLVSRLYLIWEVESGMFPACSCTSHTICSG